MTPLKPADHLRSSITGQENQSSFLIRVGAISCTLILIGLSQHLVPASLMHWQFVLQRLYYVPTILAALYIGWRGGLVAAMAAGLCYLTSPFFDPARAGNDLLDGYLEVTMFCLVGVTTGLLADREEKQKRALQQTTKQLSEVYRELQENFERMKPAERLYAIGQLSAGLAHEIRNPLSGIEGSVAILQSEPESKERRREFLEIIQKECRRLNRLVTNFLDFAKPRQPQMQPTDVAALFDSTISLAAHARGRIPITLRTEVPSGLPKVEGDPEQLKQVLLNLTINAMQSMPNGGEIMLDAREQDGRVLIQMKDQGCGISTENLDRIFDPFFTTKDTGTGLGLSVAHQIIDQHGGVLRVEPGKDRGTTFSLVLPITKSRAR